MVKSAMSKMKRTWKDINVSNVTKKEETDANSCMVPSP